MDSIEPSTISSSEVIVIEGSDFESSVKVFLGTKIWQAQGEEDLYQHYWRVKNIMEMHAWCSVVI